MDGKTKICMGVRCFNQTSCSTVPATKGEEDLQIAHLTSRSLGNVTIGNPLRLFPAGKTAEKTVRRSVFLTIWHRILNADSTKTSFLQCYFLPAVLYLIILEAS